MQQPSWFGEYERKTRLEERLLKARAQAAVANLPVRDSFHTAPGWRDLGMEFSLSEDPGHPRDSAVTKAIQIFDPKIVPLWCRWGFLPPGGYEPVIFGRHAIGRWVDNKRSATDESYGALLLKLVNQVEFIWEGTIFGERDPRGSDLPGAYLPWDWRLYSFCRQNYIRNPDPNQMKQDFIEKPKVAREQRIEKVRSELEYRARDVNKFIQKKLDQVSEVEMKEQLLGKKSKPAKTSVTVS